MDSYKVLERIKDIFAAENVNSIIEKPFEEGSIPFLLIDSGKDPHGRSNSLQINAVEIDFSPGSTKKLEEGKSWVRLQFEFVYPFEIQEFSYANVAQFLHMLNLQIEFPGFCLDYLHQKVIYRFEWICQENQILKEPILNFTGFILFLEDSFGETIEMLASGEKNFIELLEEIQGILKNGPPKA